MSKKILILILLGIFNCISIYSFAQDGFTNKEEAKNQYKDSLKEGKWIEYTDVEYRPSKNTDSLWSWYYRLSIYNAGKENGIVRYYSTSTGKLHEELPYINGKREGLDKKYDEKNQLQEECLYTNDKMNGEDRSYSDNKLSLEIPVTNDKIEGVMKEYYLSGQIEEETPYVNDKKNGATKEYDENGKLLSETPYINNQITGIKKDYCYYNDGTLWWEAAIDYNNSQNGLEKEYDKNGALLLTRSIVYSNEEHFEYEERDQKIINSILKLNRNNPKEVEKVISDGKPIIKDTLGFGWSEANICFAAGGYTSVNAIFYYYNDSIVSYTLEPRIPYENLGEGYIDSSLREKYVRWYRPCFTEFDTISYSRIHFRLHNDTVKTQEIFLRPFKFNEQAIFSPLKQYKEFKRKNSTPLSKKILNYMSPLSGLCYGYAGGLPITMLPNRKEFNEIKDSLNDDEIIALLYSINPVSRLTAIEYCIKKGNPIIKKHKMENWINKIYTEVPTISTMYGCIGTTGNSKELVESYANKLK